MIKKILIAVIIIILLLMLLHPIILTSMSDFLCVQDKLEKADVILTLAGDSNGERVAQAVELYKQKWAPKILMSGGPAIWHLTYAQNMRRQATSLGVPSQAVLLEDKSKSTFEDIEFSLPILKKLKVKTIILVSSPFHMRRSSLVARKYYTKEGIKVISYPVQKSEFNPNHWWIRHEDTQPVITEYLSLVMYLLKGKLF